MRCLAVIPARGGSKRIPGKNIRDFCGKPIIAYSIEKALKADFFDEVMVSTDDKEIAEISKKHGARIPFMRTNKTADDYSDLVDVLLEVVEGYKQIGKEYSGLCCILPTAALITEDSLKKGWELFSSSGYDSVLSVQRFNYSIYRGLKLNNNKLEMIWPENYKKRSQDLEAVYHDAGQYYYIKKTALLSEEKLFLNNTGAVVLDSFEAQDIDSIEDWKIAELKYKALNG